MEQFTTSVDKVFKLIKEQKKTSFRDIAKDTSLPPKSITAITHFLELSNLIRISYRNITGPQAFFLDDPKPPLDHVEETELMERMKVYKNTQDLRAANKMIIDLYNYVRRSENKELYKVYSSLLKYYQKNFLQNVSDKSKPIRTVESYEFASGDLTIQVETVRQPLEPVPFYLLGVFKISDVTREVIDRVKEKVINKITTASKNNMLDEQRLRKLFDDEVRSEMQTVFSDFTEQQLSVFSNYIIITSLGMGDVELLLHDPHLEEIVINNAYEPVRVYHKNHGWMETNIVLDNDSRILRFATLAGRNVEKTITTLYPLMDAHLKSGDRVNATLKPISTKGSTITIRKFSDSPWTITHFLESGTIDFLAAAIIWTAIQYELSVLIVGGTGSGKTSALNVFSLFIVPSQRIVSIEDTRELRLPSTLHWVPMETRMANPEGKGAVTMLDLVVNALRMRPDRIIVGEIRRKEEAEVLFEAMHTGHSVYATLHANTVKEAVIRLTTEPIGISKTLLGALDLIIVQNRNRRTNERRTFQLAELSSEGDFNLLFNYKFSSDKLEKVNQPKAFYERLELFAGLSKQEVNKELTDKMKVLKHLVKNKIYAIEDIGRIISNYYTDKQYLMKSVAEK